VKVARTSEPWPDQRGDPLTQAPETPSTNCPAGRQKIPLVKEYGTYKVPVEINGVVKLHFTVDTGAAHVSIPLDVAHTLKRAGTIKDSDFMGIGTYILADGTTVEQPTYRIRQLRMGSCVLHGVTASISDVEGSLLLGQSFLNRFKSWSIDNQKQVLILE
jgi:clan AA aspartic protease (TIGR02281 family)